MYLKLAKITMKFYNNIGEKTTGLVLWINHIQILIHQVWCLSFVLHQLLMIIILWHGLILKEIKN